MLSGPVIRRQGHSVLRASPRFRRQGPTGRWPLEAPKSCRNPMGRRPEHAGLGLRG